MDSKRKLAFRIKIIITDSDGDPAYLARHGWVKKVENNSQSNVYYLYRYLKANLVTLTPGSLQKYVTQSLKDVPIIRSGSSAQILLDTLHHRFRYFKSSMVRPHSKRSCFDQASCTYKVIVEKQLVEVDAKYTTKSIYDDRIRFSKPKKFKGEWETSLREVTCFRCGIVLQEIMYFNYKDLFRICPICLDRLGMEARTKIKQMDPKLVEDIKQLQIVHKITGGL